MKRVLFTLAVCLLPLLASPPVGVAQQAGEVATQTYPRAVLTKPFAPVLGDMIAQSLAQVVSATRSATDPPTIVIYDRDSKKIGFFIYGSKTTLDGAKRAIDAARTQMHDNTELIGALYHVSIDEADFAYLYFHNGENLISWEDGKYTVGGE